MFVQLQKADGKLICVQVGQVRYFEGRGPQTLLVFEGSHTVEVAEGFDAVKQKVAGLAVSA